MYKSNLGTITAFAEALYLLTELNEDSPYCGTIDLILPDATEIIDFSFDNADALKSITLLSRRICYPPLTSIRVS